MLASAKNKAKHNIPGQMSLFDVFPEECLPESDVIDCPEYTPYELLFHEKEVTGSYLSRHPLDTYEKYLQANRTNPCSILPTLEGGSGPYIFAGVIVKVKKIYTKKTGEPMAFVTAEDKTDLMEATVFPSIYKRYQNVLKEGVPVIIYGMISERNGEHSVIADQILNLSDMPKDLEILVYNEQDYNRTRYTLENFLAAERPQAGDGNIYFRIDQNGQASSRQLFYLDTSISKSLCSRIAELIGKDRLRLRVHCMIVPKPRQRFGAN